MSLTARFVASASSSSVGLFIDRKNLDTGHIILVDMTAPRGSDDREVHFYILGQAQRAVEAELNNSVGLIRKIQDANAVGTEPVTAQMRAVVLDRFDRMCKLGWLTVRRPSQPEAQSDLVKEAIAAGIMKLGTLADQAEEKPSRARTRRSEIPQ